MIVLGLTGSIGMGKSTVAAMFADAGVPVFDADATVHKLQGPGGVLVWKIEQAFPGTTGPGGVNREKLREKVFNNREALARLEAIVHPAVAGEREAFRLKHRGAPLVVLDIPLLFETGADRRIPKIAVVSTSPEIQRERVLRREGMTAERFESILKLQMPDAQKRAKAHFVIDTSGPLEETRAQVDGVIASLVGLA